EADNYEVFDYLIEFEAISGRPIPKSAWELLVQYSDLSDLPSLSFIAWHSGNLDIAESVLRRTIAAGYVEAMYNLGLLLAKTERPAEAEQWYRNAGSAGYSPAMNDLANLLRETGRTEEAEQWYRKSASTGFNDA